MSVDISTTDPLKWAPSAATSVTLTAPGTFQWSPWQEVIASAAGPIAIAGLNISGVFTNVDAEIQVGTGSTGNEQSVYGTGVLRSHDGNSGGGGSGSYLLPLPITGYISTGQRVSLRSNNTCNATLAYYQSPTLTNLINAAVPNASPVGAAGAAITPNASAWENSSWVELTSGISAEIKIIGLGSDMPDNTGEIESEFDLATGAAGSEVVIATMKGAPTALNAPHMMNQLLPAVYPLAANTRVSVRLRKNSTSVTQWHVSLLYYGAGTSTSETEPPTLIPPPTAENPCTIRTPRFWSAIKAFDSGAISHSYYYAKGPMRDASTYYGGWKAPRLLDLGTIRRQASDWLTGAFPSQTCTAVYADTDRVLRVAQQGNGLSPPSPVLPPTWVKNAELFAYLVSDSNRQAGLDVQRLLFHGAITENPLAENLRWKVTARDVFGATYNIFKEDLQIPQRTITVGDFPEADPSVLGSGVPIIGGVVSDAFDDAYRTAPNVGAIQLIPVGDVTVNGVTKACALIAGHACGEIRLYQDDTEISSGDSNAYWPGSSNWTTFSPSNAKFVDINGHRYALAFFDGQRAEDLNSGSKPVFANVKGLTTNADGTGTVIEDFYSLYFYLCTQFFAQSYQTGAWLTPPTFSFYPDTAAQTVPVFDETSFTDASALAATYLSGGFLGGFVIGAGGRRQSIRQVISDLNVSGNCWLASNSYSQLQIAILNLNETNFDATARTAGKRNILKTPTWQEARTQEPLFNELTYTYRPNYRGTGGDFEISQSTFHDPSRRTYGAVTIERKYPMIRDINTVNRIANDNLRWGAYPRGVVTWGESLCGLSSDLLTGVLMDHYAGNLPGGWSGRALWLVGQDIDTQNCRVIQTAIDVDDQF
jgi:hypothetical protein